MTVAYSLPFLQGNLFQTLFSGFILFMIIIIFSLFSPFGIGFVIFSVIRQKTKNISLRKTSFIFQIIFSVLNLIIGVIILFFVVISGLYYTYGNNWIVLLFAIASLLFVLAIEVGIIAWQSYALNKNK